ncbi:MAG: Threonylcarbamoyl-AMP synthase [Chlamydiae bacterium]|nr:Threonylcarbamoyl-AMP synthase [Chlamydiota bacterium]
METLILNENSLMQAAQLLKEGELVAFPTETVYGLGAPVFAPETIQKIYEVKGRPQDNPLIVHMMSLADSEKLARDLPSIFFQLADAFFPGPLTLVVKRNPRVPSIVSAGLDTIALRIPSHPVASALISHLGEPLVAPSANLSGRPSSTTSEHVLNDFNGKIAAVVDGGSCLHGMESTVIDLVSFDRPTLLRHGALKKEAIEGVLGLDVAVCTRGLQSSPGMKYRPNLSVHVFSEIKQFEGHLAKGKKAFVLSTEEHSFPFTFLESETLYANLRLAEENGYDEVVIYCPNDVSEALKNRLEKISHESNRH